MTHMRDICNRFVEKGLLTFQYVQVSAVSEFARRERLDGSRVPNTGVVVGVCAGELRGGDE